MIKVENFRQTSPYLQPSLNLAKILHRVKADVDCQENSVKEQRLDAGEVPQRFNLIAESLRKE